MRKAPQSCGSAMRKALWKLSTSRPRPSRCPRFPPTGMAERMNWRTIRSITFCWSPTIEIPRHRLSLLSIRKRERTWGGSSIRRSYSAHRLGVMASSSLFGIRKRGDSILRSRPRRPTRMERSMNNSYARRATHSASLGDCSRYDDARIHAQSRYAAEARRCAEARALRETGVNRSSTQSSLDGIRNAVAATFDRFAERLRVQRAPEINSASLPREAA